MTIMNPTPPITPAGGTPYDAYDALKAAMVADPEYAWAWHCNIAVPIIDTTNVSHETANEAAAHLMQHLFDCDITAHPLYEYGKSGAQSYAEFRIAMDKAEDATLSRARGDA